MLKCNVNNASVKLRYKLFLLFFVSERCLGPIAWLMLGTCSSHSEAHARPRSPIIWHPHST